MAAEALKQRREMIEGIATFIRGKVELLPKVLVVCGSGLGSLSKGMTDQQTLKYEDIPNFPQSTVAGHAGELVFGKIGDKAVVCMRGRFHSYEGYSMETLAIPQRVFKLLGVEVMVVTNAAGGLHKDFNVGDIMLINDHVNVPGMAGRNPLVGPNDDSFGPRFPPMSNAYDKELADLVKSTAKTLGFDAFLREGCYCFVSGPNYETPTESRLLSLIGGDSVGMSTVPEVLVAHHCGIRCVGLSMITNKVCLSADEEPANHAEVLEACAARTPDMQKLVEEIVCKIGLTSDESAPQAKKAKTH